MKFRRFRRYIGKGEFGREGGRGRALERME